MLHRLQAAELTSLTHKADSLAATAVAGLGVSMVDINQYLTLVSLVVGIIAGAFSIHYHVRRHRREVDEAQLVRESIMAGRRKEDK